MYITICGASSQKPYNVGEKKKKSFWVIWILQILNFKSIYNFALLQCKKSTPKNDWKLESCMAQFGFQAFFLLFGLLWSPTLYR